MITILFFLTCFSDILRKTSRVYEPALELVDSSSSRLEKKKKSLINQKVAGHVGRATTDNDNDVLELFAVGQGRFDFVQAVEYS